MHSDDGPGAAPASAATGGAGATPPATTEATGRAATTPAAPERSRPAAPWRMLMQEAALEIDADGVLRSFTCGGQAELAALIDAVGTAVTDRLRPGDRVLWLHTVARLRAGEPSANFDASLRLDPAGREWRDVSLRLAPDGNGIAALLSMRGNGADAEAEGLSELAHELRTPLNAVIGYAQALEAGLFGPLGERQRDAVAGIVNASEHLVEVANTVLDAARLDVNSALEPVETPLAPAVARACAMVSGIADRHEVTIANRVTDRAGALLADPAALRQIVVNLVSNAVKASEAGGVVSVEARRTVRDSTPGVEIAIEDRGRGMTAEELARLGRRFGRGTRCAGETTGGLGLPLVQRLVERHEGTLSFASQQGEGTRASVFLRVAEDADQTRTNSEECSAGPLRLTA